MVFAVVLWLLLFLVRHGIPHNIEYQSMLQLPEVHIFIGIAWFVQYIWEVIICVDRACVLNQYQACAYCINFSAHPRRLFLSSKCSSMVVLNDGTGFKATKSQNREKKASVSCHLPRNRSDIGMVLFGTF